MLIKLKFLKAHACSTDLLFVLLIWGSVAAMHYRPCDHESVHSLCHVVVRCVDLCALRLALHAGTGSAACSKSRDGLH